MQTFCSKMPGARRVTKVCLLVCCSDVKGCIAFPAWMHNYLAAVHSKLTSCSGFDLVRMVKSLADLGYMPARPFLNEFAAAVEVRLMYSFSGAALAWLCYGGLAGFCWASCRISRQPEACPAAFGYFSVL